MAGSGSIGDYTANAESTLGDLAAAAASTAGLSLWGDSITAQDITATRDDLVAAGYVPHLDAQAGRPTRTLAETLAGHDTLPPTLVVASGSNDVFDGIIDDWDDTIDRVVALAASRHVARLLWVNVYVARTSVSSTVRAADLSNSQSMNQQLRNKRAVYPGQLTTIDWYGFVAPNPARWLVDGVHCTAEGKKLRRDLIVGVLTGDSTRYAWALP